MWVLATAGETATFNIDFFPETSGTKQLTLIYKDYSQTYIPFADGSITIADDDLHLTGSIILTNANANGDIEGTTLNAEYTFQNTGTVSLVNGGLWLDLYKIDTSGGSFFVDYRGANTSTLDVGESQTFTGSFNNLEIGGEYFVRLSYNREYSQLYRPIDESQIIFNVVEEGSEIDTLPAGDQSSDVFSLTGVRVKNQATSLKDLPHGVYFINKRKVILK